MGSAGEVIWKGATTAIGFTIGAAFGNPALGASLGYNLGSGVWSMQKSQSSSVTTLGPVQMTKSHRLPVPIVYGEHQVGGNVIYQDSYGDESPKLDLEVAVSEGPIEDIYALKANDVTLDASNYEYKFGTRDQTTSFINDANHPYTAYVAVQLDSEEMELSGAPTITSIVKGRKVEVWDSGTSSWVTQYSQNPAYCLLDYLTNDRYGMGINEGLIDKDSFVAVANWCDETVDGSPRYEMNMLLDRQASSLDILQQMLQTFQAFLIYSGGELRLKADTVEDSTAQTFDEDNIVEDSFGYEQTSGEDVPNVVQTEYVDPDQNWEMVKAEYANDTDIRNRGRRIKQTVQLPGVTSFSQAARLTRVIYNKMFYNEYIAKWEAGIDSIHCEPGDVVEVSHTLPGWSNRKFRIMEIREKENEQMEIVAQEYNEAVFSDQGAVQQPPTGPDLPIPTEPPPNVSVTTAEPLSYNAEDGTYYETAHFTWDRPADYPFYKRCNIYQKKDGDTWPSDPSPIAEIKGTELETSRLEPGTYNFKLVAENRNGIAHEFSDAPEVTVTISGKVTPPPDISFTVSRFTNTLFLEWETVNDKDFNEYEVRTDNPIADNWGVDDSALVYQGDSNQIQIDEFPVGDYSSGSRTYDLYLRAKNDSGLYSNNAGHESVTKNISAPTVNIVEFFESFQIELTPPSEQVLGYEIKVLNESTSSEEVFDISKNETLTYSADPDYSYSVKARSYDVIGYMDWPTSWAVTGISPNDSSSLDVANSLDPAEIVESEPTLPDPDYPDGSWIVHVNRDGSGNIIPEDTVLKQNVSGTWTVKDPPTSNGQLVVPSVVAGVLQVGAVSADEIRANAVGATHLEISDTVRLAAGGQIAGGPIGDSIGFEVGKGFWLGEYTSDNSWRFYIGDKDGAGEYLSYENGNLTITGNLTLTNEGELRQTASANMVNNAKFEYGMDGWEKYSGTGSATVKTISDAKVGANVIEMTDEYGLMLTKEVPIDPDKLYYTEVWLRRITNPGTQGDIYLALAEYDHTGTLIQTNWRIADGADLYEADGWTKFSAEIQGSDFHADTTYIKPLIYPGYPDRTCVTQATYFRTSEIQAGADLTIENRAADIVNLPDPDTINSAGLYATGSFLGFNDGSGSGGMNDAGWQAAIKGDGTFYFAGDSNHKLEWNGSELLMDGRLNTVGVDMGRGVFAGDAVEHGIKVTQNAKVEIEDSSGAKVFSVGGEFQGTRIIDQGTAGSQNAVNDSESAINTEETVWSGKSITIPPNKAWLVRVTIIPGTASGISFPNGIGGQDDGVGIQTVDGFKQRITGVFQNSSTGSYEPILYSSDDSDNWSLWIHYHMGIYADNLSNSLHASAKVYWQVIEVPESAVG